MPDTTPSQPGGRAAASGSPTVAEVAALTARLRRFTAAGAGADQAEREAFLADKHALLDRIAASERAATRSNRDVDDGGRPPLHAHTAQLHRQAAAGDAAPHSYPGDGTADPDPYRDYRTYTPGEAAEQLAARGIEPDDAAARVERHLAGLTSQRGWAPPDGWEIDDDDLDTITARESDVGDLRGDHQGTGGYGPDPAEERIARADAAVAQALAARGITLQRRAPDPRYVEQGRGDQLARWHAEGPGHALAADDARVRGDGSATSDDGGVPW